jgi:hypothetical protein
MEAEIGHAVCGQSKPLSKSLFPLTLDLVATCHMHDVVERTKLLTSLYYGERLSRNKQNIGKQTTCSLLQKVIRYYPIASQRRENTHIIVTLSWRVASASALKYGDYGFDHQLPFNHQRFNTSQLEHPATVSKSLRSGDRVRFTCSSRTMHTWYIETTWQSWSDMGYRNF